MFASSHAHPQSPTTTPIYPIAALILQCFPPCDNQQTLSHTIMLVIEPPKHCAIRAPMGERYSAPLHYYCRSPPTTLKLHLAAHLWRFFSARSALRRRLARSAQSSSGMGGGFLPFYGFALGSASLCSATLAPTILRLSIVSTSQPRFAEYGASRAIAISEVYAAFLSETRHRFLVNKGVFHTLCQLCYRLPTCRPLSGAEPGWVYLADIRSEISCWSIL